MSCIFQLAKEIVIQLNKIYLQWSNSNAFGSGTESQGFNSKPVKPDAVLSTVRHRCNIL